MGYITFVVRVVGFVGVVGSAGVAIVYFANSSTNSTTSTTFLSSSCTQAFEAPSTWISMNHSQVKYDCFFHKMSKIKSLINP
jgi:hypothetical protein